MIRHFKNTRLKRKVRTKYKIRGTAKRPRIAVFRSHKWLFVQAIDDSDHRTLVSAHDKILAKLEKNKIKRGQMLGENLGEELKKMKINSAVFDRSGYTYHGRVQAVCEGLRAVGIKI